MHKSSSPLDTAYNRLDEAHRAWHFALNGYHRIGDFRAGINANIQALRNLTFALQKQKDSLAGFDDWYEGWRVKMVGDSILKELHEARNVIVKEDDLKLHSTATARTKGWIDYEKMVFEFDPMNDSVAVASGFYETYARHLPVPEEVKKRLVFQFERKWVYDKLPEFELLEALAYAYNFFFGMLRDANKRFALSPPASYVSGDYCPGILNDENKLKCMAITSQERCLTFGFNDGAQISMHTKEISRDAVDLSKAKKRYGDEWKSKETLTLLHGLFPDGYPYEDMKVFAQVAVSNLKKDGYLIPISFIFKKEKSVPVSIVHPFQNQEQKVITMDSIATDIIKNNGVFVLTMCEIWLYRLDDDKPVIPTQANTKNAREALQISYISAEKVRAISIPFRKNIFGRVIFSKPEMEDFSTSDQPYSIFRPLVKALRVIS